MLAMNRKSAAFLSVAAAVLAVALYGCMQQELASRWPDREITIDGKNPEWAGAEAYYDEDQGIKIGLSNDDRYLYVYLATWHRQLEMQILTSGFTIWFDPKGGTEKTFAVAYPLKRMRTGAPGFAGRGEGRRGGQREPGEGAPGEPGQGTPGEPPRGGGGMRRAESDTAGVQSFARGDPRVLEGLLMGARSLLEVIGPAKGSTENLIMPDTTGTGISAMIGTANRMLVYELKIPLAPEGGAAYAIHAKPGQKIGVGFIVGKRETENLARPEGAPPSGMGEGPEGMGGYGGYGGGGRGSFGGLSGGQSAEPLEMWTKVKLASGPPAAAAK